MNKFKKPNIYILIIIFSIGIIGILFSKRQWMFSKRFGFVTPSEMISTYFKSDILRILIVVVGIGFAIPSNSAQRVINQLIEFGAHQTSFHLKNFIYY